MNKVKFIVILTESVYLLSTTFGVFLRLIKMHMDMIISIRTPTTEAITMITVRVVLLPFPANTKLELGML